MVRIQNESLLRLNLRLDVATINQTAGIGSKKSIKRQFESDLKRVLALGRLNRISLAYPVGIFAPLQR